MFNKHCRTQIIHFAQKSSSLLHCFDQSESRAFVSQPTSLLYVIIHIWSPNSKSLRTFVCTYWLIGGFGEGDYRGILLAERGTLTTCCLATVHNNWSCFLRVCAEQKWGNKPNHVRQLCGFAKRIGFWGRPEQNLAEKQLGNVMWGWNDVNRRLWVGSHSEIWKYCLNKCHAVRTIEKKKHVLSRQFLVWEQGRKFFESILKLHSWRKF